MANKKHDLADLQTVSVTDAKSKIGQVNPLPILYCSLDNKKGRVQPGCCLYPLPNLVANPLKNFICQQPDMISRTEIYVPSDFCHELATPIDE